MVTIILIVVFGIFFSYFATLNTELVSVNFGQSELTALPLYVVILISISLGVLITYIIHLIQTLGASWNLDKQDRTLSESRKEIAELTREVHQLELENTKLKAQAEEDYDEDSI